MKRITAIILFVVMLLTAIQPVIAMHYCGDELSSLRVYQTTDNHGVCCNNTEHHHALISDKPCCETELMKLSTDEYQTKTMETDVRISPLSIDVIGYALINQLYTTELGSNNLLYSLKFPSKGLYLGDVSILTYICIYRI